MKFFILLISPFILLSCSDLAPKDDDTSAPAPPPPESTSQQLKDTPTPSPAPETEAPTLSTPPTASGPESPLDFLDPDTTGELMTEEKKKTVTSSSTQLAPTPAIEGNTAIEIDPPKLPELKE